MEQLLIQIPVINISIEQFVYLALAALAGGAFGAALGALPAFCFTGFLVFIGEGINALQSEITGSLQIVEPGMLGVGITGTLGFGAVFGPHVSFAGGVAASAYIGKKYPELEPTGWDYHPGKVITEAYGTKPDILAVGAIFGFVGWLIVAILAGLGLPADNVAISVFLSAMLVRVVFDYPLIGSPAGFSIFDMSPFENGEERPIADGGTESVRMKTEVWLGHQYKWSGVTILGLFGGLIGGFLWVETGTFFLGYAISAMSLLFLNLGVEKIPVTHHITLLGSVGAAVAAAMVGGPVAALLGAAGFGALSAIIGEISERIFYAHSGTHVDPPAIAIAVMMLGVGILYVAGFIPVSGYL